MANFIHASLIFLKRRMSRLEAFRRYQSDIALFSRDVIGTPLHPYQTEWAQYILDVVAAKRNETIVIEMPRQSGKNEASSQLQVAILARAGRTGGDMVKIAPTFKPQIVNSKARFELRSKQAQRRLPFLNFKPSMGYIYKCHRASISFLSAEPTASVVGATASLCLEVDEAQDIDKAKLAKDFNPMRASTGAPIILYGTTWTDDTVLEDHKRDVQEGRAKGRYFRILPEAVAESNPAYGDFVDAEVKRLGRDHPFVKTQYFLEPLPSAGRMLTPQALELMIGAHAAQTQRTGEAQIVAGLDFAGADENAGELVSMSTAGGRDSVALTIGAVDWLQIAEGLLVPHVRILARYEWVNINPVTLHSMLYGLIWDKWRCDLVHCDATGIGETGTAFLAGAINKPNRERIVGVKFDGAWTTHTRIAFNYLAAVNGGHLKDHKPAGFDPVAVAGAERCDASDRNQHIWWQRGHAKLEGKPGQKVRMYVPDSEGHDDLLISEALMVDAAYAVGKPMKAVAGQVNFYGN